MEQGPAGERMTEARSLQMPASRWLPPTRSPALMATVMLLAASCLAIAASFVPQLLREPSVGRACVAAAWLLLAIGLWRLNGIARWVAIVVLWAVMLVGVTGFMHPEVVGNAVRHPETALGTGSIILRMAAVVVPCLLLLHLLGRYRAEFGRRRTVSPEEAPPRQEARGTR